MKDLVIIGAGGSGQEIAFLAKQIGFDFVTDYLYHVIGFIDDNPAIQNTTINDIPVIGTIDDLLNRKEETYAIISIANCKVKQTIVEKLKKNPFIKYPTLVHQTAITSPSVSIGEGSFIYPYAVLTVNIKIGQHVLIGPKTGIGHGTVIEDYSSLLWNTNISGNVILGQGTFIGTNATILQELKTGPYAIIGAGAVVIEDIPGGRTVVGVPAKVIK